MRPARAWPEGTDMGTDQSPEPPWRMVSIPVSPYVELVRWVLDWFGLPYTEQRHAPFVHLFAAWRAGGGTEVPILVTPDGPKSNARRSIAYVETIPSAHSLRPADPAARTLVDELYEALYGPFGIAVRAWAYAYMLPGRRAGVRVWSAGAPTWERWVVRIAYPVLAFLMRRVLRIGPTTIDDERTSIQAVLDRVAGLLADGRRYLAGDAISLADLTLASLAAPAIVPAGYGGPLPTLDEMPPAMRAQVERWRAEPAGQFILRLYRDDRGASDGTPIAATTPTPAADAGPIDDARTRFIRWLTSPRVLRLVFGFLRRFAPILVVGKTAVVSRHADVTEVLRRDEAFTIREINGQRFDDLGDRFILGMDRSPEYVREEAVLRAALRPDDLPRIRAFVAEQAAALVDAARPSGRIDLVGGLTRLVPTRLVATYFGVPGPDEPTLERWLRDTFHYAFLADRNDVRVRTAALRSAAELRTHLDAEIARRKQDPDLATADDMLGRLVAMQGPTYPWLDDDTVRRNVAGVVVGVVDTTSKFTTLAIEELLRRPRRLQDARAAALAGDLDTVRAYAWEAVRFNGHTSLLARHAARDTVIAAGTDRERRIPAGSTVVLGTLSATFDPDAFDDPDAFRTDRGVEYLHFGAGTHQCLGLLINGVEVPELVAAVLRLSGLRPAAGRDGAMRWDGPFPDRWILEFDRSDPVPARAAA